MTVYAEILKWVIVLCLCPVFVAWVDAGIMPEIIRALKTRDEHKPDIVIYKVTDSPYNEEFEDFLGQISQDNVFVRKDTKSDDIIPDTLLERIRSLRDNNAQEPQQESEVNV